jgi:DNA-binding transcriptional MocR family regulator
MHHPVAQVKLGRAYERHIHRVRRRYAERRAAFAALLVEALGTASGSRGQGRVFI